VISDDDVDQEGALNSGSVESQVPQKHIGILERQQEAERSKYFEADPSLNTSLANSFLELNLSRPLLRAVTRLKYHRPSPIQARCIPLALAGRDICASAQTGSGKTAAFLLPVFERLLFRSQDLAVTRALIVTPTRELATQIHSMGHKLSQFTDIRIALVVGGLSVKAQQVELRTRPDVVVCTPGRMIDHFQNSLAVHMDEIEVLILDEADRLLDEGFTDEVEELVKFCPRGRQTMLFSATMTEQVESLVKLSLNRPVRVSVGDVDNVADRLTQEFVRVRETQEDDREAIVTALIARSFKKDTILFCDTKKMAHRMVIVLGLLGLKAAELHGNLSQKQRLESLELFKRREVAILVATDLASRGLDIEGVATVVNMKMPRKIDRYIHRVGRTARAGRSGRAVTLVGEVGRPIMKQVVKQQRQGSTKLAGVLKSRSVPAAVVAHWKRRMESLEEDVEGILDEERTEKQLLHAEMEAQKAMNVITHQDEITYRPVKTWFQSEDQKSAVKTRSVAAVRQELAEAKARIKNAGERKKEKRAATKPGQHRLTRKKRRRQAMDRELEEDKGMVKMGKVRSAKKKEKLEQDELLGRKPRKSKKKKGSKTYSKKRDV